jgi:hypothetical protein
MPWRSGLVVSSLPATEENGAISHDIVSRQGIWCFLHKVAGASSGWGVNQGYFDFVYFLIPKLYR